MTEIPAHKLEELLPRAFLRQIQLDNKCDRDDGFICRNPNQCGCFLEMMNYLAALIAPKVSEQS